MSEATSFQEQSQTSPEIAARFPDLHPAFDKQAAVPEANRCLYCFDAPCMQACHTHIDVPKFIKKIASGNLMGSAKPIEIGRLQRFAMDSLHESGAPLPFSPGANTGKSVALIGGGPASLACAAELRRRGIRADIYDARPLPGGLNTYGIAEYKLTLEASLREIDMLAQLGVSFHFNVTVDAAKLAELEASCDAVFLGLGLGAIHRLGVAGEQMQGVTNALDFIAGYKSGKITSAP